MSVAFYFLGAIDNNNQQLYEPIQRSDIILGFSEHHKLMLDKEKGNVDANVVFAVSKNIAQNRIAERMFWYLTTVITEDLAC